MAAFGAVLGPVPLASALQDTSSASASLMLTLEKLTGIWVLRMRQPDGLA